MRLVLLFMFTLSSCGGVQMCIYKTRCGMCYVGLNDPVRGIASGWTQESFQVTEDYVLGEFMEVTDPRFRDRCKALDGWTVRNYPARYWKNMWDTEIAGQTFCLAGVMEVNNDPPARGSLPHEMAHAIQKCTSNAPKAPEEDADHAGWWEQGIYRAIERAADWGRK